MTNRYERVFKIIICVLVLIFIYAAIEGCGLNAFAEGTKEDESVKNIPIKLTSRGATFSVSLPVSFPYYLGTDGEIYVSQNVTIENKSRGRIKLSRVTIKERTGEEIVKEDELQNLDVGKNKDEKIRHISFSLLGCEALTSGEIKDPDICINIDGKSELPIAYSVSAKNGTSDENIYSSVGAEIIISWK